MCIVNKLIVCFQKFPVLPPPYLRIRKNKIKNNVKYLIFDVGGEGRVVMRRKCMEVVWGKSGNLL